MSEANLGHSALDAAAGITEVLAGLEGEDRLKFLRAAVSHAWDQSDIAEEQYARLVDKYEKIRDAWESKIDEADAIRVAAASEAEAFTRELEALEG